MTPDPNVKTNRAPLCILLLAVLGLGGYASWLNHQFYTRQIPFFDSVSYTNYLARVIGATQLNSFKDGLAVALDASTTPLPGLEALLLALLHIPVSSTRQLGVWLQVVWLLALAVSLYFYWLHDRRREPWASVLLTLPFLFFAGVFSFNGGLSDFRPDLSLYILLASASVWYLRTYSGDSKFLWLLVGIFVMLASLSRATAPVYWVVIAGPLLVVRLVTGTWDQRKRLLQGVMWMILPSLGVALPFFLTHFAYLYYYYAEWNQAANAHLSWAESMVHVRYAHEQLGWAMGAAGLLFCAAVLVDRWRLKKAQGALPHNPETSASGDNRKSPGVSALDWKLLYIGTAPVMFLVLRGAGLHPFVSMPAVFGWLMFLLAPLRGTGPVLRSLWSKGASLLLLGACLWNASQAPGQVPYPETRMSAMRQGIDWMREDSLRKKLPRVDFVAFHSWNFHPFFMRNVLINEYGYRSSRWFLVSPEGIPWEPVHVWKHSEDSYELPFTASDASFWDDDVAGATDAEKIESAYQTAQKDIDYVFFPDDATIDFMEQYIAHNFINTKVRAIKKRFLDSGEWEKIGTPLAITDFERVQLYTKRR